MQTSKIACHSCRTSQDNPNWDPFSVSFHLPLRCLISVVIVTDGRVATVLNSEVAEAVILQFYFITPYWELQRRQFLSGAVDSTSQFRVPWVASSAAGRHVFGLRPKTREAKNFSRGSLFKTWPKPETAHEKSLTPRVSLGSFLTRRTVGSPQIKNIAGASGKRLKENRPGRPTTVSRKYIENTFRISGEVLLDL